MEREIETDAQVYGMPEAPADPVGGGAEAADPFQAALDEYGEAHPPKVEDAEPPAPAEQRVDVDEYLKTLPAELKADIQSKYDAGLYHLQQVAQQVSRERDRLDAERLFDSMRKDFPDLSDRILKAMLSDRYHTDERTASAWRSRYENKAGWSREVERIKTDLYSETRFPIDHDQTETNRAVIAAVTRGGGISPREPAQENLSSMSDAEYQRHIKEEHGYTPRLR